MTAPIRDYSGLVQAIRDRREVLNVTNETLDGIAGLTSGYTSKLLAPTPIKNLGPMSFGSLLGALGMALIVVEDQEQIERVKTRWIKRKRYPASFASAKRIERLENKGKTGDFAFMQMIGKKGGKKSGMTRRKKAMRLREIQAKRSHAARSRWAKREEAARYKDGKGKQRALQAQERSRLRAIAP